jgi:hypothetical protein
LIHSEDVFRIALENLDLETAKKCAFFSRDIFLVRNFIFKQHGERNEK